MNDYLECTEIEDLNTENSRNIAECIGIEAFRRLVAVFSGEQLYIRSLASIATSIRRKQAAYDYSCGMKCTDISRKYKIPLTSVYDIVNKVKAEPITTTVDAAELISYNDLPEDQKEIADCIGFDNLEKLAEMFPSMQILVPKYERVCMIARNRSIYRDYLTGSSISNISKKYDLHYNTIRDIIKLMSRNA